MFKIFGKEVKTKPRRKSSTRKKVTYQEVADKALVRQAQDDKDWALQIALQKEGLKVEGPAEKQQKKIDEFITKKALEELETGESELLDDAVREKISTILGSGQKRRRGEPESYYEPGSSISQALQEVESLSELREKLQELGMVEGSGGGFLKGLSMKEILAALPYIATLMGKGEGATVQSVRTYVVRVDGRDQELTEPEYRKLLQEGRITPIALELPKPEVKEKIEEVLTEAPELPDFLKGTDFTVIEGWMEQEPGDFVINLKGETDTGIEESRLVWGFLTTANYEGIVEKITPYKEHPIVGTLVQRILSGEGKIWLERVLELVQESKQQ